MWAAELARGDRGDDDRHHDAHRADGDRRLLPELEREELDQTVGRGIERIRPAREEEAMERFEEGVEGDERERAPGDEGDRQALGPATDRSPRSSARLTMTSRSDHQSAGGSHQRDDEEPDEHAAHVAHVFAFARVEHRLPIDRHVEVGWPKDQVGEDRVGRLTQVAAPSTRSTPSPGPVPARTPPRRGSGTAAASARRPRGPSRWRSRGPPARVRRMRTRAS